MSKSSLIKKRISITIVPFVNDMLEVVSQKMGISKSLLVEKALKDFLQDQLENDTKSLANLDFSDLPSENEWLKIQSNFD